MFCNGKISEATNVLETLDMKKRKADPDTLSLLGYGHLLQSKDDKHSKYWEKAKSYFTIAKTQADRQGLPSSEIVKNLNYMSEDDRRKTHRHDAEHSSFWTLPLSPRRESELMQSVERDVDFLFHELKKEVQENDFIFVTGSDSTDFQFKKPKAPPNVIELRHSNHHLSEKNFRVFAVYKVVKKPVWHPYIKNQGLLELIHRFPRSVFMSPLHTKTALEMTKLSTEEKDSWLNQLEEHISIRDKINAPVKKQRQWQIQKSS
jgi:hypothetical protein